MSANLGVIGQKDENGQQSAFEAADRRGEPTAGNEAEFSAELNLKPREWEEDLEGENWNPDCGE